MSWKTWTRIMLALGMFWAIVGIFTHNIFDLCIGNFVMIASKIDLLEDRLTKK